MPENNIRRAIILITKTPGRLPVKTRLAPEIGTAGTEEIYCCFLRDIGDKCRSLDLPLRVYHLPGTADEQDILYALLGPGAHYFPQRGQDLGARMQRAFATEFDWGRQQVLLIGGDCPDLPPESFTEAFEALQTHDCVLGPTADGGYYLIGFRASGFAPAVFDFPDWGAVTVYAETVRRLQAANASFYELAPREDVDTLAELKRMWENNQTGWFADSHTMQAIRRLGLDMDSRTDA